MKKIDKYTTDKYTTTHSRCIHASKLRGVSRQFSPHFGVTDFPCIPHFTRAPVTAINLECEHIK